MKKIVVLCFTIFLVFKASAQQEKNQLVFSIGTANNINGSAIQIAAQTSKASPVFNFNIDRGMNEKFSLGLAYCYQQISLNRNYTITTYNYSNYTSNVVGSTSNPYTQNETMQHFGIRFLFHSNKNSSNDFYGGVRLGYQFGTTKNTMPKSVQDLLNQSNNSNSYTYSSINNTQTYVNTSGDASLTFRNKNRYTQQIIIGYRYFWDESFGVFGEGALGFPYFMNIGLSLRI